MKRLTSLKHKILTFIVLAHVTRLYASGPAVITEIMADPSPAIGLPEVEWIEILNASDSILNLGDWQMTIGSYRRILPETRLEPGEYLVLTSVNGAEILAGQCRVMSFASFPAIRNSGTSISLADKWGRTSDSVSFSDGWYGNSARKNGGWSLERIDPARDCDPKGNWTASNDPLGGTPGRANSVLKPNADLAAPFLLSSKTMPPSSCQLTFSEPMDTLTLGNPDNYSLSKGVGHPTSITIADGTSVTLTWSDPFPLNENFRLEAKGLCDLCGNLADIGFPDVGWILVTPGDVILNEVLFNPWPGGKDFVEILNLSQKIIDPAMLLLAGRDKDGNLRNINSLTGTGKGIQPREYVVYSAAPDGITPFYSLKCPQCLRLLPSLPPLNNDEGIIVLLNDSLRVIDEFAYDEKMHHRLIFDREGISLERIDQDKSTNERSNWHSASPEAGFATPGYRNSQSQAQQEEKNLIEIEPMVISPNSDGHNDEMKIFVRLRHPGWLANITLFSVSGLQICRLRKNALLPAEGILSWNGRDENGKPPVPGPYILFIELFNLNGDREIHKKGIIISL